LVLYTARVEHYKKLEEIVMKKLPAFIAAFIITACIGVGILALAANALFNQNTVALASAPSQTANVSSQADPATIQQMQDLINQYQQREKQYQDELNQASQQLADANQQISGYQNILQQLQQMGVINISRNGQISVPQSFGDDH
jgi:uncharacterized protein HemX